MYFYIFQIYKIISKNQLNIFINFIIKKYIKIFIYIYIFNINY